MENGKNNKIIIIPENKIILLKEDVYTKGVDTVNKKANISYQKGYNSRKNNIVDDYLKTDKMDNLNSDTYIVPLKNGINSYNITSIKGTEVMHYFKRHFSNEATTLSIELNGKKDDYELQMEQNEMKTFLIQFVDKVNAVISDYITKHKELTNRKIYKCSQVCIYPVKSSSNFNSKMVDLLLQYNQTLMGLPIVKLNENLFKKDVSNIQKDKEFLRNNMDYYKSYRSHGDSKETHMNGLNTDMNMLRGRERVNVEIQRVNEMTKVLLDDLAQYRQCMANGNNEMADRYGMRISKMFAEYFHICQARHIMQFASYVDDYNKNVIRKRNISPQTNKYTYYRLNSEENENDTQDIFNITKKYNPMAFKEFPYNQMKNVKVVYRQPLDFQIKKLYNDSRMGLKNLFKADEEGMEQFKQMIEGNILIIFDDNVSGGATLSDICAQFLNVGVKHILPITFGEMRQQWAGRDSNGQIMMIRKPKNGFVFGDKSIFAFNGKMFDTSKINNPMDAANVYKATFGKYDKDGAVAFWNAYKDALRTR